jgi:hypothetical protein
VFTLSAIMTTLPKLLAFVQKLGDNDKMRALDRAMCVMRKKTAVETAMKLQAQKISLTLILTILTWYVAYRSERGGKTSTLTRRCDSNLRAEETVAPLGTTINKVLEEQQFLSQRLANFESRHATSIMSSSAEAPTCSSIQHEEFVFNPSASLFEKELWKSWVYKRTNRDGQTSAAFSIMSSARKTAS